MKQIALLLILALSLLASGCSTTRKTTTTNTQAEAQLTATTEGKHHAESTGKASVVTNVTTDESLNVVIDFARLEFDSGAPSEPTDSTTARDWLNAVIGSKTNGEGEKAKPPNVKAVTFGRVTISGDKNEQSRTETQTEQTQAEDTDVKQNLKADSKEAEQTKTEEKPKFTFWDWIYLGSTFAVALYAIIWAVRFARRLKNGL